MNTVKQKTGCALLREARVNANMTQGELAKRMGYSNMQYVSNWERGVCGFPTAKAPLFCKITGMKSHVMKNILMDAAKEKINKIIK